jgi:hypothetical protein
MPTESSSKPFGIGGPFLSVMAAVISGYSSLALVKLFNLYFFMGFLHNGLVRDWIFQIQTDTQKKPFGEQHFGALRS